MCGPAATIVLLNHSLSLAFDEAGVDAAEDAAGAAIDGLRAVAVFDAVVNLAFVAVHEFARNAAEEEAAVEAGSVADALELQHEVAELLHPIRCSRGPCW